jgi:uncharacterized delta-60 repeat protein
MQKLLKKLSKIASSLLSLAIISSSLFIAIPPQEASALIPAGQYDSSYNFGAGPSSSVEAISIQNDGKILIGGWFTQFNGINRSRIARLDIDGSLDTSFDPGNTIGSGVWTLAIQEDEKVVVGGGSFVRLNSDGSLDGTFNTGSGPNNSVIRITIQESDQKILIGGWFTQFNGINRSRIARLNSNGSLDTSFDPGNGTNGSVAMIKVQDDGKILIGGWFTEFDGVSRNYIARLNSDGTLDSTFNPGTGPNDIVETVEILDDGKILIGGEFTSYNGTAVNRIARLHSDGSLDTNFNTGVGANGSIETISVQTDGRIIIAGGFTEYNSVVRNHIARLNIDGSLDTTFDPGNGLNEWLYTSYINNTGTIFLGGDFTTYDNSSSPYLVAINGNTLYQASNLTPTLDLGINGTSLKVGTQNGSRNPSEQVTLKATGNVPLSDFVVDFSNGDVDFSGVTAGSDSASGKAFLSGLNDTAIPELSSTHSLYIPKLVGQTSVHICPDATQMSEVFMGCSNGYTLNYGGASNLSIVNISGQDYWRVTGLTGTGGLGTYSNGVSLTITPNNGLENVAQEVDVTYTSGGSFVSGDVIQLTWDAGITLANCATPTTDADGDLTNDGSSSVVGQTYTYTYTGNATSSVDLCMSVQGLSGNYAVTLNDDNGSFSSALYYINPEGGDVNVIANIAPTLSFNIRNIDDSADLNVCNFGDVSTSTPIPNTNGTVDSGECGYSLAVGTNSSTGFTMQMSSNGALTNGVSNINNVVDNGTWSAGEEAYGIAQVIVGQTGRDPLSGDYDQSLTREGNFLTDTTPVPTTATDFVTYTDGVQYEAGNLDTDVTKVIHGLVVGAGTPAGSYSQVVTYTVTASF